MGLHCENANIKIKDCTSKSIDDTIKNAKPFKESSNVFPCVFNGCDKTFRRRDKLEIHLRTHTGERPFKCHVDGCGKAYIRQQHLERHVHRVHTTSSEKLAQRVNCPMCQAELANSHYLQIHLQQVHKKAKKRPSKLYKCPEQGCGQEFSKKPQLVSHRLTHTGSLSQALKVYRCPEEGCDKVFDSPHRVRVHQKVHKCYTCDVCDEPFPTWSALRKHKAVVHKKEPTCGTCGAVFKTQSNLNQHRKTHNAMREPITCPFEGCDRIYFQKKNLTHHIKVFHEKGLRRKIKPKTDIKEKPPRKRPTKSTAASWLSLDDRGGIL